MTATALTGWGVRLLPLAMAHAEGLQQASADHFGANPEAVLWGETAWLHDATAKLKEIADQHFKRGEYAD